MKVQSIVVAVAMAAGSAIAADVSFIGSDGNLGNAANWSAVPAADSALSVDGSGLSVPDNAFGLKNGTLPGASLRILNFGSQALFDLFGGTFAVPKVEVTANTGDVTISGGATGLSLINVHNGGTVILTNGVYDVTGGIKFGYSTFVVASDAKLNLTRDCDCGASDVSGNFTIDGGEMVVGHTDPLSQSLTPFYLTVYGLQTFKITNGGKLTCAGHESIFMTGFAANFVMDKGSTFDLSNGQNQRGFTMGVNGGGKFTVEDSTFKCANLMSGYFVDSNASFWHDVRQYVHDIPFTFKNSTVSLWKSNKDPNSGIVFTDAETYNNTMTFEGANSSLDTGVLYWGGSNNVFNVKDGTFAIDRLTFFNGRDNKVLVSGGVGTINKVTGKYVGYWQKDLLYYGINGFLSFSGDSETTINTSFDLSAEGMKTEVKDTASVTFMPDVVLSANGTGVEIGGNAAVDMTPAKSFKLTGDGNYVSVTDSAKVKAHVRFEGSNGRLFVGDGATFLAEAGTGTSTSVYFGSGSGNELVISNGTFESAMFCGAGIVFLTGEIVEGAGHEAIPFENCPNAKIVFQGDHPKFLSSLESRWPNDWPYFAGALGRTCDAERKHTDEAFALKDSLKLRFELPENAYAEAPFRCTRTRGWVFGGNAVIEFDASRFHQGAKKTRIPLVYMTSKFKVDTKSYINVDQLNETNADNLPVFGGRKAKLALNAAGDTLELVVPGTGGFTVLVR